MSLTAVLRERFTGASNRTDCANASQVKARIAKATFNTVINCLCNVADKAMPVLPTLAEKTLRIVDSSLKSVMKVLRRESEYKDMQEGHKDNSPATYRNSAAAVEQRCDEYFKNNLRNLEDPALQAAAYNSGALFPNDTQRLLEESESNIRKLSTNLGKIAYNAARELLRSKEMQNPLAKECQAHAERVLIREEKILTPEDIQDQVSRKRRNPFQGIKFPGLNLMSRNHSDTDTVTSSAIAESVRQRRISAEMEKAVSLLEVLAKDLKTDNVAPHEQRNSEIRVIGLCDSLKFFDQKQLTTYLESLDANHLIRRMATDTDHGDIINPRLIMWRLNNKKFEF